MELLIHFCDENRPDRFAEYLFCLEQNIANCYISKIHCFRMVGVVLPDHVLNSHKMVFIDVDHRSTFKELLDYANNELLGRAVVIANLDIFLSHENNWVEVEKTLGGSNKLVLAQSRTEYENATNQFLDPGLDGLSYANAQDAWIFKTPVFLDDVDFEIGTIGADNALADRFKKAGYIPMNLASRYRIFHYDVCRGKTSANAVNVHYNESKDLGSVFTRKPEERGYYLVPDFDRMKNIDNVLNGIGMDDIAKYMIICDILTQFVKIDNSVDR